MDILRVLKAIKRWKFTVVGVSFIAFALIALAPNRTAGPEIQLFESRAKILLTPPSKGVAAFGGRGSVGFDQAQSWFADATILQELFKSEDLLRRVAEASGSKQSWQELRNSITVQPISQNAASVKLFQLSAVTNDPKSSQKVTRLVTEEFSNYVQEISAKEFAGTRKFIEELVTEAEQRRLQAEERLMAVREKYLGAPSDLEVNSQQSALETQRREIGQSIPNLQAEVSALSSFLNGETQAPPWAVMERASASLSSLETEVTNNQLKLEQAREVYTEENDHVVSAKARLDRAKQLYQKGLQDYARSLRDSKSLQLQQLSTREQSLSSRLNSLLAAQMTPEDRREVQKLERELSVWEENHLSLSQQLYQARVEEQSSRRQGSVTVLEQPLTGMPFIPEGTKIRAPGPGKMKKLATALPFCLILGVAAGLLREYLSSSMKLRPRVEEILEIPVIAVIPACPSELTVEWELFKRPMIPSSDIPNQSPQNGKSKALSATNGAANGSSSRQVETYRRPE